MSNIDKIGSLSRYRNSLCNLCYYSALLQEYGGSGSKADIVYAATMVKKYKQFLLSDKAMLGFTDGLSFMEDNCFRGYEIRKGVFSGERDMVLPIVKKWVTGFPESANNYQYEVAMYTLALAFPEEIKKEFAASGVRAA